MIHRVGTPRILGATPFFRRGIGRDAVRQFDLTPLCGIGAVPDLLPSGALRLQAGPASAELARFLDQNPEIRLEEGPDTAQLVAWEVLARMEGPVMVPLDRPGFTIYGHWLLDILPRLLTARALLGERAIFVTARELPAFARSLLEALRLPPPIPRPQDAVAWMLPAPSRRHDHLAVDALAEHVLPAFAATARRLAPTAPQQARLYVSRRNWRATRPAANTRRLINAGRVEEMFASAGFAVIHPEAMPVAEQIALFAQCRMLAGEAGSGLHNSIFMPHEAGSTVVNLQSGRQTHLIQASLCAACGQRAIYVIGQPASHDWSADFEVAESDVAAALATL